MDIGGSFNGLMNYLNPQSNAGNNFWSSSAGKTLAGASPVPSFDLSGMTSGIQNPVEHALASFPVGIAQSLLNTPSDFVQGPINLGKDVSQHNLTPKSVLGDIAPTGEAILNVASLGSGAGVASTVGRGLIPALAKGATLGGEYGAGYGALNAAQSGKNIKNNASYVENLVANIAKGGGIGALTGSALAGVGHGVSQLPKSEAGTIDFNADIASKMPKTELTMDAYKGAGERSPVAMGISEPTYGKGDYYTTNKDYASVFGDVTKHSVTFKKPLYISNQNDLDQFTRMAISSGQSLTQWAKSSGFDGLYNKLDETLVKFTK